MLAASTYPQDHVDDCRAAVAAQLETYDTLAATADEGALAVFAPRFFAHMTLALDAYFMHRQRGKEGKDGNAMNEVRLLCAAIMEHGAVLQADKQIKLKPETSVLGLAAGDVIVLDRDGFGRLAAAYFDAIAAAFT